MKKSTPPVIPDQVEVVLLTGGVVNGKRVVYETRNKANAYLVDADKIPFTMQPQLVDRSLLEEADRPYDWTEEIERLAFTVDELRLALYYVGMVQKSPVSFKDFITALFRSGKYPIKKEN